MIKEQTIIKKDSPENWAKAKNFIPKENEIVMYNGIGIKIGNGKTKINDLPFATNQSQILCAIEGSTLIIETKGE